MHKRFKNLLLLPYCVKFINLDKVYFLIFFRLLYEGMLLNLKFFELQPYNTLKNRGPKLYKGRLNEIHYLDLFNSLPIMIFENIKYFFSQYPIATRFILIWSFKLYEIPSNRIQDLKNKITVV